MRVRPSHVNELGRPLYTRARCCSTRCPFQCAQRLRLCARVHRPQGCATARLTSGFVSGTSTAGNASSDTTWSEAAPRARCGCWQHGVRANSHIGHARAEPRQARWWMRPVQGHGAHALIAAHGAGPIESFTTAPALAPAIIATLAAVRGPLMSPQSSARSGEAATATTHCAPATVWPCIGASSRRAPRAAPPTAAHRERVRARACAPVTRSCPSAG